MLVVNEEHLTRVIEKGQLEFGSDNRAALRGSLHRVSQLKGRSGELCGLTIRVGRAVLGCAEPFRDILQGGKSVLFLGEVGCGKSTLVRDAARLMAETLNVLVVDTSNELGGSNTMPDRAIGQARRLMVPAHRCQQDVMLEGLQNHTPHVIVVDEIGRPSEVRAACTVKQRGVRVVASCHGSFASLMKNPDLRGLLGGVAEVTKPGGVRVVERATAPVFDIIVEVEKKRCHDVFGFDGEWWWLKAVAEGVMVLQMFELS